MITFVEVAGSGDCIHQEKIYNAFKGVDISGDGRIDRDEFLSSLQRFSVEIWLGGLELDVVRPEDLRVVSANDQFRDVQEVCEGPLYTGKIFKVASMDDHI